MADNISITQGSGTTIATEDVSGVQHQKVKLEFGTDGVATLVSASDPLPITGTVTVDTSALATSAKQNTGNTSLGSIDTKTPSLGQALAASSVPVVLTAAQISNLTPLTNILPYTASSGLVSGATSDITNQTATTIITGVASNYLYITNILVTNSHATVGTFVNITEETSGTVLYTGYAAALGGGFSITLPAPLKVPTAGKALQATCVTTGTNVRASASGYKSTV